MGHEAHRRALGGYAAELISYKARQLVRSAGWNPSDLEDIAEELVLAIYRRLPNFDPTRAKRDTFINRVVEHAVCDLIASRKAKMRDFRRCRRSLQDPVPDEGGEAIEFGETLGEKTKERRTGTPELDEEERRDLRSDLASVVDDLPPHLRDLVCRLHRKSPSEVARETGVPRTTLLKRMQKIRELFDRAGLAQYVQEEASD